MRLKSDKKRQKELKKRLDPLEEDNQQSRINFKKCKLWNNSLEKFVNNLNCVDGNL